MRRKMTSNVLDATGFASPASEESKGCFLGFLAKLRPLSLSQLMSCQEKIKKNNDLAKDWHQPRGGWNKELRPTSQPLLASKDLQQARR